MRNQPGDPPRQDTGQPQIGVPRGNNPRKEAPPGMYTPASVQTTNPHGGGTAQPMPAMPGGVPYAGQTFPPGTYPGAGITPQAINAAGAGNPGAPALVPGAIPIPLVPQAPVVASAIQAQAALGANDSGKKQYRITKGGMVDSNGVRTALREGKIIDNLNYDVRKLSAQGIHMVAYDPDAPFNPVGAAQPIPVTSGGPQAVTVHAPPGHIDAAHLLFLQENAPAEFVANFIANAASKPLPYPDFGKTAGLAGARRYDREPDSEPPARQQEPTRERIADAENAGQGAAPPMSTQRNGLSSNPNVPPIPPADVHVPTPPADDAPAGNDPPQEGKRRRGAGARSGSDD